MLDGKKRCFGNKKGQELYASYHDNEWGRPVYDDIKLFEYLILEGAQAGLSFETVLKKREQYRKVFYGFDPAKVAAMRDNELEALLQPGSGIIRNRLKIFSTRSNAIIFLSIQKEFGSFSKYFWGWISGMPIKNHFASIKELPSKTALSEKISKDLKKRGMRFVGPTIIYAYMQAAGLVNDHLQDCWLYSDK